MEAEQHKHRHEDRGQNRPDGRSAGDKHAQQGGEQRQADKGGHAAQPGGFQQVGQAHRHKLAHVAPVEHGDKLRQREHHHDKPGHLFHRLDHQLGQIALTTHFPGGDAVRQRHHKKEQDDQRHDAFNKRRGQYGVLDRIAQNAVLRHYHQGDGGDKQQRYPPGNAQPAALLRRQRIQLLVAAALPLAQTRLNDPVGDQPADNSQHNHRTGHKVPVVDHADVHRGINGFGRFGADAGEQHVGGDDQQVGGKTAPDTGNGRQQARHRMASDGEEDQRAHRRHDDQRRIGRDMAEEGDKQHHIAGVTRADVRGHFHHQGRQQAGTFGQAGTQHQGQDRPQRGKAAEVFNHIR